MDSQIIEFFDYLKEFFIEILIFGAVFFLIEKVRPAEKKIKFFKEDFKQEVGLALLNFSLFSPLSSLLVASVVLFHIKDFIPYQIFNDQISVLPVGLQVLAACFLMDFSTYWRHRFTHNYMWPFHSIHHAATHISWITALRLHPIDLLVAVFFDVIFLHIFGFSAPGIFIAMLVMKCYNYFTHANLDIRFAAPVRYIFASPNYHRWHHAVEKEAHNKNYCSMFSLLDVMFGTYYHPEDLPQGYGLSAGEQAEYPDSLWGWIAYPFIRVWGKLQKRL